MAYYLQFDGVNDYVSLPFSVAIPAASNGSVIFTAESPADSEVYGMFGGIGERFTIRSSDIFFRLNGANGNTITHATIRTFVPTYDRANKHTYELRKTLYIDGVRTQVHLYIDGVYCGLLISHFSSTGPDIKFNSIGVASTNYARMNLYSFDIVVNGVYTVRYDPSASNGTGLTLIDTEGGSNGTLVNFPSDNSQWVFYDDGGGASTYDAGGQSSFSFSSAGGVALTANAGGLSGFYFKSSGGQSALLNAGAGSSFNFDSAGGAAILASCGSASEFAFSSAGGVTADFVAGGQSQFSIISTGGAEVVSDGSQTYDAGGASSFNVNSAGGTALVAVVAGQSLFDFASAGGATLIAGAGANSEIEIITLGGAAIIANAGGESIFSVTSVGGATVNEQSVIIDRIIFPASRIEQRLTMARSSVLKSITIPAAITSRAVL